MSDPAAEIAALKALPMRSLKRLWEQHFDHEPLAFQRDHMIRRIAYQLQVDAYGGLPKSALRKLQQLANTADVHFTKPTASPGTELIREYNGRPIRVRVLAQGFEYNGKRYASLSAIASEVAGCRVSGPKFFGLRGDGHAK